MVQAQNSTVRGSRVIKKARNIQEYYMKRFITCQGILNLKKEFFNEKKK